LVPVSREPAEGQQLIRAAASICTADSLKSRASSTGAVPGGVGTGDAPGLTARPGLSQQSRAQVLIFFRIDAQTEKLTFTGEIAKVPAPSCAVFVSTTAGAAWVTNGVFERVRKCRRSLSLMALNLAPLKRPVSAGLHARDLTPRCTSDGA
jgi:hypothetical protein